MALLKSKNAFKLLKPLKIRLQRQKQKNMKKKAVQLSQSWVKKFVFVENVTAVKKKFDSCQKYFFTLSCQKFLHEKKKKWKSLPVA